MEIASTGNVYADFKLQVHAAIMEFRELGIFCSPPFDLYVDVSRLVQKFREQCVQAESELPLEVYAHLIDAVERKIPSPPPMDVEVTLGPAISCEFAEPVICNVCFEEVTARDSHYPLECGHIFHDHCLRDCVIKGRKATCPNDRKQLSRAEPSTCTISLPSLEFCPENNS